MTVRAHTVTRFFRKWGRLMQRLIQRASRYFILFMAISFLGWGVETLFFLLCYGKLCDRGFMTLPFCTIYGCSFLLLYFLIGTPNADGGGLLQRWNRERKCPFVLYFLLSALIPTGLELITGYFFHRAFGIRLWNYSAYRLHFNGYICLEYALLWGILIPPCMKYFFIPLKERVFALPMPYTWAVSSSLVLLATTDWIINFSHQKLMIYL